MQETETNIIIFSRVAALEMEKRNLESFLKYLKKLLTA
jgi:hypothetical protein